MPYSSGTTGRAEGRQARRPPPEQIARMIEITQTVLGISQGMRTALVAPLYHSAPASYGMQSLLFGDLVVIHERFDAERLLADIERHKLDRLYLVPTHFVRLLRLPDEVKRRYDLSSVEYRRLDRLALPARSEEADDRLVGPGDQRELCVERGRLHHAAARRRNRAPIRARPAGRCRADVRIMDDAGNVLPPFEPGLIYCRQTRLSGLHLHQPAERIAARSTATGSSRSATSAISTATAISTSATASPTW